MSSAWSATGCRRANWSAAEPRPGESGPRRYLRPATARADSRRIRDRHRLPSGGPDHRRHREPQPDFDVREQHRRAPGICSKRAAARPWSSRSSWPPPTKPTATRRTCPTPRTRRSQGTHPYDVSKSCADLIGPDLRRQLRPARGDHALRQLLRRRRSELEPDRPRNDPLRAARRAARDPLRRQVHSRLLLRRRWRRRLHDRWPSDWRRALNCKGQAFNFSNEIQVTVLRTGDAHPETDGIQPDAGHPQRGLQRNSPSIPQRAQGPRSLGWRRCSRSMKASIARSPGTGVSRMSR